MRGCKRVSLSIFDLILNSPRFKLSQPESTIEILDNRDTRESTVDFLPALKRKNTAIPDINFNILVRTQIPTKLVINKIAIANDRETWIPFKI